MTVEPVTDPRRTIRRNRLVVLGGAAAVTALFAGLAVFAGTDEAAHRRAESAPGDICHQQPGTAVNGHYVTLSGETWNGIAAKMGTTGSALRAKNLNAPPSSLTTALPTGACIHVGTDPAATTTTAAATSTAGPTTAAPTTAAPTTAAPTTTAPATTVPSAPGTFTESFDSAAALDRWTFAHARAALVDDCPAAETCTTDVNVTGGKLVIRNGDQNYGDATLRSLTKYDLSSGGTVVLDISDDSPRNAFEVTLSSAYVMFSAGPQDAKHQHSTDIRPEPYGPDTPSEGVVIWLRDNCVVPHGPPAAIVYPPVQARLPGSCGATPDGRLRLVYTPGSLSVRNGANAEIVRYDVTLPQTGWLTLGVHNHASWKYSLMPSATGTFDNVSYPTGSGGTTTTTSPATTTTTTAAPTTTAPATTAPPTTVTPTTVPAGSFAASFTTPSDVGRFDLQLHTANQIGGQPVPIAPSFIGEHDDACGDPTTHREVEAGQTAVSYLDVSGSELVWYCAPGNDPSKGHMMTALDTEGIAYLSFSPKETFTDVERVCWDQNMNDLGGAKWVNVFVVPASDVTAKGGNLNYVAAEGLGFDGSPNRQLLPTNSYHLTWLRGTTFVYQGYTRRNEFWKSGFTPPWAGMVANDYSGAGGPSAPRFTICLDDSGRVLSIERPDGSTDVLNTGGVFPTGAVRVIFQDGSYNPTKHDGFADHLTWHWDNIEVS